MRQTAVLLGLALTIAACGDNGAPSSEELTESDEYAYAVSHILFSKEKHSAEEARTLAWQAWRKLQSGGSFEDVASRSDDGQTRRAGGFVGFVPTHHDTAFSGAVQVLRPGQLSAPVLSGIGYQIIKRHPFLEGRHLEQRYKVALYGFYVPWGGQPGGKKRTKEEARALADEALATLRAGQTPLQVVAAPFLDGTRVRPDCFLGVTGDEPSRRHLFDAVKNAREGTFQGPVESPKGWAILQRRPILRSLVRDITIQYAGSRRLPGGKTNMRPRKQALALAKKVLAEALADPERFEALAKKYSEDGRTVARGGTIGVVINGQLPLPYEESLMATEAGKVGPGVVETEYGFHVFLKVN